MKVNAASIWSISSFTIKSSNAMRNGLVLLPLLLQHFKIDHLGDDHWWHDRYVKLVAAIRIKVSCWQPRIERTSEWPTRSSMLVTGLKSSGLRFAWPSECKIWYCRDGFVDKLNFHVQHLIPIDPNGNNANIMMDYMRFKWSPFLLCSLLSVYHLA